jgi:hypothetical protein
MKPTEHFLSQIRDRPENRVVNAKTLRFLKGLRKNLPTKEEQEAAAQEREEERQATTTSSLECEKHYDDDDDDTIDYDAAAFDPLLVMA